jgi:hypothetical protein
VTAPDVTPEEEQVFVALMRLSLRSNPDAPNMGAALATFLAGATVGMWRKHSGFSDDALLELMGEFMRDKAPRLRVVPPSADAAPASDPASHPTLAALESRPDAPAVVPECRIVRLGPHLFSFASFDEWVNHAQSRYHWAYQKGYAEHEVVAIDAAGRVCAAGLQFMRARAENLFPVSVYSIGPGAGPGDMGRTIR